MRVTGDRFECVRAAAGVAGGAGRSAMRTPLASESRRAWDAGAFVDATIYDRERLRAGAALAGPAIVEQYDTTTWIPAGWRATVDPHDNLLLEKRA